MRPSDDRISFLAHHIVNVLLREKFVETESESESAQVVKQAMIKYFQHEDEADRKVRAKIASIKRGIPEGSEEWDILYNKYFDEEITKQKC